MKRTLSLKRESLTELTAGELAAVAGGQPETIICPSIPLWSCISCDAR